MCVLDCMYLLNLYIKGVADNPIFMMMYDVVHTVVMEDCFHNVCCVCISESII